MKGSPLKIGIVGAGNIAIQPVVGYIPNLLRLPEKVQIVALADVLHERAQAAARHYGIAQAYASLDELLERADVAAVVNLTNIPAHAATSLKILAAGKHCVSEKPIATTLEEADALTRAITLPDVARLLGAAQALTLGTPAPHSENGSATEKKIPGPNPSSTTSAEPSSPSSPPASPGATSSGRRRSPRRARRRIRSWSGWCNSRSRFDGPAQSRQKCVHCAASAVCHDEIERWYDDDRSV